MGIMNHPTILTSILLIGVASARNSTATPTVECNGRLVGTTCLPNLPLDNINNNGCPEYEVEYKSIIHYLDPWLFEDPKTLQDISKRLQRGELVVIRNAFVSEYAEAMHCDLDKTEKWQHHADYLDDGFHYSHHNIYDKDDYSYLMRATQQMMEHPDSKQWMSQLTGRDCMGDTAGSAGSPSYYMPGDHSLPHSDHTKQRTVAYVWHLTKNWRPEWGGALYWAQERLHHSFVHASFNTLSLFSVHSDSAHFVTTVSPHAEEKRLSFNGWYSSSWWPKVSDNLEHLLATPKQRWDLTDYQLEALRNILESDDLSEEQRNVLQNLMDMVEEEVWPTETESLYEVWNKEEEETRED